MASPARTILGRKREPIPLAKYAQTAPVRHAATEPATPIRTTPGESKLLRKIDQAARVLDKLEAKIADLAADIKALQKLKNQADALRERIEDGAITYLQMTGHDSMHGRIRQLSLKTCPPALKITDESQIPEDYMVETTTTAPDNAAIKKLLVSGIDIPGCTLTTKVRLERK